MAYGNLVDTLAPDTFQILREIMKTHYPYVGALILTRFEGDGGSKLTIDI